MNSTVPVVHVTLRNCVSRGGVVLCEMGDADEVFAVRLALPDGSSRKVHCDAHTNVEQILQAVAAKVSLRRSGTALAVLRQREIARVLAGPGWLLWHAVRTWRAIIIVPRYGRVSSVAGRCRYV